jgi:hypothetical protein
MSQFSEADTANTELSQVCVRSAADFASVVSSGGILGSSLLLINHRFFCHLNNPP